MSWSKTGRMLLVWPNKGQVLNQQLELILVNRHAKELGAQLAFVTHDTDVRFFAKEIGIPVFKNLRQAQHTHWRMGKRKKINLLSKDSRPDLETLRKLIHSQSLEILKNPAVRIISFSIAVLALFVLGIFILPGATIFLTPQEKMQSITLSLIADPSLSTVNLSTGGIPTYNQEVIVEGSESSPVTGSMIIPDQIAIGGLRFTNISDHEITVPKGTVVTSLGSDPVRFITSSKDNVTIPPGKSVMLSSRSIKPGTSGNVLANSLVAIEGVLGSDLLVTNLYPTHGGTDASVPAPTDQDIKLLREQLVRKLEQTAIMELNYITPTDDILITPTIKIVEIIDETPIPARGEPGKKLNLSMRLRVQSQVVAAEELLNLATPILEANTPTGYSPVENTIKIEQLTSPILGDNGIPYWKISAYRKLQPFIAIGQAINLVKGLSATQAMDRLNDSLPLAAETQIIIAPEWWPRLPLLPMRIQVIEPGK
jgi:hypothetical protein